MITQLDLEPGWYEFLDKFDLGPLSINAPKWRYCNGKWLGPAIHWTADEYDIDMASEYPDPFLNDGDTLTLTGRYSTDGKIRKLKL